MICMRGLLSIIFSHITISYSTSYNLNLIVCATHNLHKRCVLPYIERNTTTQSDSPPHTVHNLKRDSSIMPCQYYTALCSVLYIAYLYYTIYTVPLYSIPTIYRLYIFLLYSRLRKKKVYRCYPVYFV